jgi:hypothetical protein
MDGVADYNVRSAFLYAWDSDSLSCHTQCARAFPAQRAGLRAAAEGVLAMPAPVPRRLLVKGLIPIDEEFLGGGVFAIGKVDQGFFLDGLFAGAAQAQMDHEGLAFEIGYALGEASPDVVVKSVTGAFRLSQGELTHRKTLYLLRGHCDIGLPGGLHVRTIAPGGPDEYRLVSDAFSLPMGEPRILGWTPETQHGNQALETDLKDHAGGLRYEVLLERRGSPAVIRVGGNTVFAAADLLWYIGHETENPAPRIFFSQLVGKLAYGKR